MVIPLIYITAHSTNRTYARANGTLHMNRALITGVTGQDGSYLAEQLIAKGYEVHGVVRRSSTFNRGRIDPLWDRVGTKQLYLHYGDLQDVSSLSRIFNKVEPDEIYNLAAQSHVHVSFDIPEYTAEITGLGALRMLEALRICKGSPRFYHASSSEMFGASSAPQNEMTPFLPRSPYAASKVFAYHMANNYREAYGLHISSGILFNHESPRRGENFLTRKVTRTIARIKAAKTSVLKLGNLEAKRDWGYAPEYTEAMHMMLQQPKGDNYVIATGETHSVKEFVQKAFQYAELDWEKYVQIDPYYYRPTEVMELRGDATKAQRQIGWKPKVKFDQLVSIMVDADLQLEGLAPILPVHDEREL